MKCAIVAYRHKGKVLYTAAIPEEELNGDFTYVSAYIINADKNKLVKDRCFGLIASLETRTSTPVVNPINNPIVGGTGFEIIQRDVERAFFTVEVRMMAKYEDE